MNKLKHIISKMLSMDFKEIMRVCIARINRNNIILTDTQDKTTKGEVNLHWWKQKVRGENYNLGDFLSTIVVEYVKDLYGISSNVSVDGKTKHLYGVGSIVDGGYQDATVWGSGVISNRLFWWRKKRRLDIRCCRGPLTRNIIIKNGYVCPEIYGDPALLMPLIYQPQRRENKSKIILIHHCSVISNTTTENDIPVLSIVTDDYKSFIDSICQAKKVISSSLHGIILAEAYGIPAVFLYENGLDMTKFEDYYLSTGRRDFPIAHTIAEAKCIEASLIPDFTDMREKLIRAFPVDLYADSYKNNERNLQ